MPRNMSFSLTTEQIKNRTKTVTRRLGWANLKPGELFWAVEKAMGLKPGEKIKRLALLRCVSNTPDCLFGKTLTDADVVREGFPDLNSHQFAEMFMRHMRCRFVEPVNRIEFEFVENSEVPIAISDR